MPIPQSSRPSALLAGFLLIVAGCVLAAGLGVPPLVIAGGAAAALLALRSWWEQAAHRRAAGRCVKCDYDLTGNVSGVCPECGTPCGPRPPI